MNTISQNTHYVLITGAAGGLGAMTCRTFASRGWKVFAADISVEAVQKSLEGVESITPISLDVTSNESVQAAVETVSVITDRLDGIVNFAGIMCVGSTIEMDEAKLQRVLDINVMGTFRVNKAFFPLILKGRGRIVNTSSETGWQSGAPFNGAYGMSKHAIEAYSDSTRRELMLLGVDVIKIQPGPFKTNMVAGIAKAFDDATSQSTYFKEVLQCIKGMAMEADTSAKDPQIVADTVYEALTVARPKAAYSIYPDKGRSFLERLPVAWADKLIYATLSKKSEK